MIVAGLDIGGTKSAALLADVHEDDIRFLEREQIETKGAWQGVLDNLCEKIKNYAAKHGPVKVAGISCGGPLSSKKGVILSPATLQDGTKFPPAHTLPSGSVCRKMPFI